MGKIGWVLACCLGMAVSLCYGEDAEGLRFSGFYSLAATHVDADLPFLRDLSLAGHPQTEATSLATDSRLGVQLTAPLVGKLDGTLQLLAANRVGYQEGDGVQWAFLSYPFSDDVTARVGRLGVDMFMLSDYRNVGYAYPWARPVADYYGVLPLFFFDGADVAWKARFASGMLSAKLGVGETQGRFGNYRMHGRDFVNGTVEWQDEDWRARVSYGSLVFVDSPGFDALPTSLRAMSRAWPDGGRLAGDLGLAGKRLHFFSLGGEYNPGDWWAQAEVGRLDSGSALQGDVLMGYASAGYHFGRWLPYLTVSAARSRQEHETAAPLPIRLARNPAAQQARTAALDILNQNYIDQQTLSLGVRWDWRPRSAWKLQWDMIHADPGGAGLWGGCNACRQQATRGQVWTLSLDGVF